MHDLLNPSGKTRQVVTYLTGRETDKPYEVLPHISCLDPKWQSFLIKLHERLSESFPPSKRSPEGGLEGDAIVGDWSKLFSVMGVPFNPRSIPPFSAPDFRKEIAKRNGKFFRSAFSPEERKLAEMVVDVLWNKPRKPRSLSVKKKSSAGYPTNAKDVFAKMKMWEKWRVDGPELFRLMRTGQLKQLHDKHGIVNVYTVAYRMQPETEGKKRLVPSFTGPAIADSTLPKKFNNLKGKFRCCRSRKVQVGPQAADIPSRVVQAYLSSFIASEYANTLFNTDANQIATILAMFKYFKLFDFDNQDIYILEEAIDICLDRIGVLFGPDFKMAAELNIRAAQIVRNDWRGQKGIRLEGDPYSTRPTARYQNPSGNPLTARISQIASCILITIHAFRKGVLKLTREAVAEFWAGRNPKLFPFVTGDNFGLASNDEDLVNFFCDLAPFSETFHYAGKSFRRQGSSVLYLPNLDNFVMNLTNPGRDIRDPMRGDVKTGYAARRSPEAYGMHPALERIDSLVNDTFKSVYGITMDEFIARSPAKPRTEESDLEAQSLIDSEVLRDPDKVSWLYDSSQVSQRILAAFFLVYDSEEVEELYAQMSRQVELWTSQDEQSSYWKTLHLLDALSAHSYAEKEKQKELEKKARLEVLSERDPLPAASWEEEGPVNWDLEQEAEL